MEYLFRGKRVDNGEWIEGSLVNNIFFFAGTNCSAPYIINPDEYEEYCCMEDIGELAVKVLEETVGQFTGLLDKHGRKIFEGDIMLLGHITKRKTVIEYDSLRAKFVARLFDKNSIRMAVSFWSAGEVIGNIHDNPEPLKE